MTENPRVIVTIRDEAALHYLINWATERRREWECKTIEAGWEFQIEIVPPENQVTILRAMNP